jgi:hypothetical protein
MKELVLLHWNPYCVIGLESASSFLNDEAIRIIDAKDAF